ncbi:MAG: hypothetical protein NT150_04310 [Bacteroidetes bacterium]|nr:hypothetical protein [Bacteroidota bacterium]
MQGYKSIIFSCIFMFISDILCAQNKNEFDDVYTPPATSLMGAKNFSHGAFSDGPKNIIKLSPTLLTRSIIAINYERFINPNLSLTGGLGYAFSRDWMLLLSSEFLSEFSFTENSSLTAYEIIYEGSFVKPGNMYYGLGMRIYYDGFLSDDINSYVDLSGRFYANTFAITSQVGTTKTSINNSVINMSWGFSSCTSGKIQTTHDFYFGFGMRVISYNKFVKQDVTYNFSTYTVDVMTNEKINVYSPTLLAGYTFGVGW